MQIIVHSRSLRNAGGKALIQTIPIIRCTKSMPGLRKAETQSTPSCRGDLLFAVWNAGVLAAIGSVLASASGIRFLIIPVIAIVGSILIIDCRKIKSRSCLPTDVSERPS